MDRENCATEIGKKMKSAVKAKLLEICGDNQAGFADDELPEYVMIMVANKKNKQQMINDLKLFLDNKTELFVSWLHEVLQKLEKVKVPVAAQKEKSEDSRRFNEAEEMLSRKKIKKERAAKNANDKLVSDVDRKEKLEHISQRDEEKLVRKLHIKVEKSKQTERTAEARAVEDGGGGGGASSSAQKSNEFFVLTGDREKDLAELAKLEEQIKEAKKYLKVNELEDDDDEDVYSIDESKDDTSTQASSRRRKSPIVFDLEASGEPHNKMSKREGSYSADMRSSKDFYGSEYRKNEHTNDSYGNYAKYSKDTDRNEYSRGFDSNKSKERNDFRRNDYYNNDQQSKRNNNNNNMRNNFRSNDFQRRNNNNNTQSFRRNDNQQQQHRNNYQRNDNNFSRGHHNNSNNDSRTSSNRRNDFKDNNNFRRNDVSSNDSRMNRRNNFTSFKDRDNSNYNDARRSSSRDGHKNNLSNSFLSNHSSSGKRRSRSKETTYRNPFSNTYRPTSNKRSMSKEKNHFTGKSSFTQLKDRDDKRSERNDYRRNDVRSTSSHRDDYRRKDSSRARDSHRDERAKNDRNKISRDSHRDRNSSERDRERYYDDDVALRDRLGKQRSRR